MPGKVVFDLRRIFLVYDEFSWHDDGLSELMHMELFLPSNHAMVLIHDTRFHNGDGYDERSIFEP